MKNLLWVIVLLGAILIVNTAMAEETNADAVIRKMITVLEDRHYSNKLSIITKKENQVVGELLAGVARKQLPDGNRILLVILEPESAAGIAYLFSRQPDLTFDQWIYLPYVGRVRKMAGYGIYESFLGTDFTFADISYSHQKGAHTLLEKIQLDGITTYKIETTPKEGSRLYLRIITWVSKDTYLPLRQDYYDLSGTLWKQQFYENITRIDHHPIALSIRILDLRAKTSTEFKTSDVSVDSSLLTDKVFVPEQLEYSLVCPVWEKVCYPNRKSQRN